MKTIERENIGFHKNNVKSFEYPTINGKYHGSCKSWTEDGTLNMDQGYSHGERTGISKWYFGPKGALELMSQMTKGEINGVDIIFRY